MSSITDEKLSEHKATQRAVQLLFKNEIRNVQHLHKCNLKISELLKEVQDVLVNVIGLFFIDEMACTFDHNNFLQQ